MGITFPSSIEALQTGQVLHPARTVIQLRDFFSEEARRRKRGGEGS
jgi:hypothetical protein